MQNLAKSLTTIKINNVYSSSPIQQGNNFLKKREIRLVFLPRKNIVTYLKDKKAGNSESIKQKKKMVFKNKIFPADVDFTFAFISSTLWERDMQNIFKPHVWKKPLGTQLSTPTLWRRMPVTILLLFSFTIFQVWVGKLNVWSSPRLSLIVKKKPVVTGMWSAFPLCETRSISWVCTGWLKENIYRIYIHIPFSLYSNSFPSVLIPPLIQYTSLWKEQCLLLIRV